MNIAEGKEREFRHKDYLQFLQRVWAQSKHGHANYTSESGDVPFDPRCRLISYKSLQRVNSQGLKEIIFHSVLQTIKDFWMGRTKARTRKQVYIFCNITLAKLRNWKTKRVQIIQGEHKNTPWIQSVTKSKLTGIFLQNWWLQLHKLIQFHVVSPTLNGPPSCYSANIDAIIYLGPDSLQHIQRDRVDSCSETDGRPECPFLWSQMQPLSMKFLCHFKMDLLVGGSTLNLSLKARCTLKNTVCFMKIQHAPATLLWSERHLAFHCSLAAGGNIKNFLS